MPNPQAGEARRSETVAALSPNATGSQLRARRRPRNSDDPWPVPEEQQPGHRPEHDQDRAETKVAEALGIPSEDEFERSRSQRRRAPLGPRLVRAWLLLGSAALRGASDVLRSAADTLVPDRD